MTTAQQLPTYTAQEIKKLCSTIEPDYIGFACIRDIIEDEIELYSVDELAILCEASMIMFVRGILYSSLRNKNTPLS